MMYHVVDLYSCCPSSSSAHIGYTLTAGSVHSMSAADSVEHNMSGSEGNIFVASERNTPAAPAALLTPFSWDHNAQSGQPARLSTLALLGPGKRGMGLRSPFQWRIPTHTP